MKPLDLLKQQIEKLDKSVYTENIQRAAIKIGELFDEEGHSGFSISFFYAAFCRYAVKALRETKEKGTWVDSQKPLNPSFGAGEMEEKALADHMARIAVLDEFNIQTGDELDRLLDLIKVYCHFEPIPTGEPLNLKDPDQWRECELGGKEDRFWFHNESSNYVKYADGSMSFTNYASFSDNGGLVWWSGSYSRINIDENFDTTKAQKLFVTVKESEDGKVREVDAKRSAEVGTSVRDRFGKLYEIEALYPHADTTQPYYTLKQVNTLRFYGTERIIVSESALLRDVISDPYLKLDIPVYCVWARDEIKEEENAE